MDSKATMAEQTVFSRLVFMFRLGFEAGNLAVAGGALYLLFLWSSLQLGPDQLAIFFMSGIVILPVLLTIDFLIGLFLFLPIFRLMAPLADGERPSGDQAAALWERLVRFPVRAVQVSLPLWIAGTAIAGWWMVRNQAMPPAQALLTFPGCALLGISTSVLYYFRSRIIIRPVIRSVAPALPPGFVAATRNTLFGKTFVPIFLIILALTLCLGLLAWLWRVQGKRETALAAARMTVTHLAADQAKGREPSLAVRDFELFTVRPFIVGRDGGLREGDPGAAELDLIRRHPRLLGQRTWEVEDPLRAELTKILGRYVVLPREADLAEAEKDLKDGGSRAPGAVWPWADRTVVIDRDPLPGGLFVGAVVRWRPGSEVGLEGDDLPSYLLVLFALIVLVITGFYSFWFARDLSAPLGDLRLAMERGIEDRSERPAVLESRDEFGGLAGSFNRMSRMLKDQVDRSADVLAGVRESTAKLSEVMNKIVQVVAEQASGSSQHAVTIQQISTTSEEMAATLRLIAESAKSVDEVAGRTLDACHQGQRHLSDVSDTIGQAVGRAQEVAEKMLYFQEQTNRIEGILGFITDVSERINLIALNASIEASAFGEAGGRFSIVAKQMRDLAEKTMGGAKQIQGIFQDLQTATSGAIMATEEGGKQVAQAQSLTDRAAEDFQAIVHWAGETARSSQEIAFSSNQQTSATDHLATALSDIRDVAGKIAETAKILEASINELDNTGNQLNHLIAQRAPQRDREDDHDQQ